MKFRLSLVLLLSFFQFACEKTETEVSVEIQVKTNKGEVVDGADVLISDILAGTTNAEGKLELTKKFAPGSRQKIEIYKNSDQFYYARYVDSFQVAEKVAQKLNIMATLYYAPKPTDADETSLSEAETPEIMTDPLETAKKEIAAAEVPKVEEKKEETELAESTEPNIEEPAEAEVKPEVTAETPVVEEAGVETITDQIALSPVTEGKGLDTQHFKKSSAVEGEEITYTVHAYSNDAPVPDAAIWYGSKRDSSLEEGCKTNVRGRCVLKFTNKPGETITLMAKKQGYQSTQQTVRLKAQGIARFEMKQGQTIDVFAYQKRYNDISGLSEVEVYIDNKRIGSTDRFGHFSYVHPGQKSDLIQVSLKTKKALPESFDTDFVVSGPMTLVRYYTPKTPPPVKMALIRAQPGGEASPAQMRAFDGSLDRSISAATQKTLFALTSFEKYPTESFLDAASRSGRTLGEMIKKGWATTDIKSSVDVAVVPTIVFNKSKNMTLEISLVDSKGQVIAAAKEILEDLDDKAAVAQAVRGITEKLTRIYPFEGAVIGKEDADIKINLGYSSGRGVRKGDELLVYGIQSDKLGQKQNFEKIATLSVTKVEDSLARATIVNQKPRSIVQTGDLVVLHSRTHTVSKKHQIRVIGKGKAGQTSPVEQANLYFNGTWIGATDNDGRLYYDKQDFAAKGLLKVIHYGHKDYAQEVNLQNRKVYEVRLVREMAFVRVDSKPQGATVTIDGEQVGKTPLYTPIPVGSGFVKLEILGPQGYKTFQNVLELERGTLDLTGANTVELEQDYRSLAMKRLQAGEFRAAIKRLEEIPKGHSDYLRANHEIGEIYLQKLNEPANAAAAFAKVTEEKAVSQYTDKRFIGTHINEGIALFMTAEKLKSREKATAQAHYLKAIEKLDSVSSQIRFVPKQQFSQATNNIGYYRALSYQNLWYQTKDQAYLNQAFKSWRDYLEQAKNLPVKGQNKKLLDAADVYFKQAKASVEAKTGDEVN